MLLLILDTETNSLTPKTGQIIEIAGVLVELSPQTLKLAVVSTFESLVKLEGVFDERITRLTSITQNDLQGAKDVIEVQHLWSQWLEHKDIAGIIGHSIDFDLSFLKSEGWYYPDGAQIIDTLDIAKVLYPSSSAVNLEYLANNLNLLSDKKKYFESASDTLHRALYDAELCTLLFAKSLEKLSLSPPLTARLLERFLELVIPLDLILFAGYEPGTASLIKEDTVTSGWFDSAGGRFHFDSQIKHLLATNDLTTLSDKLDKLSSSIDKQEWCMILINIASSLITKLENPKQPVFLHLYGQENYVFAQSVLEFLDEAERTLTPKLVLEQLTSGIAKLYTTRISFAQSSSVMSVIDTLISKNDLIAQWIRHCDFWVFYANQLAVNGSIDPYATDPKMTTLYGRLTELQELSSQIILQANTIATSHPLGPQLSVLLVAELSAISNFVWKGGVLESIKVSEQEVELTNSIPNPTAQDLVTRVATDHTKITTYASKPATQAILSSLGLPFAVSQIQFLSSDSVYHTVDAHNLPDHLTTLKGKQILVLITQNKLLDRIQNLLASTWTSSDYLLYGEHGGITKLISKVRMGYRCPVFVRLKDWYQFSKPDMLARFESVVVVGLPYQAIPKSFFAKWGAEWENSLRSLRLYQIESIAGQALTTCSKSTEYWNV